MPRYPVTVTVKEIKEELPPDCPVHEVGDQLIINNGCIEGKMCLPVLAMRLPRFYGLCYGMPGPNVQTIACPDKGKVVYEVRRDPTKWWKEATAPLTDSEFQPPEM
ncbi:MAG: TIGR04076 family protein [Chloroflexi bacterium]|nr:TIGR04076 family protein [Chloroflexota bacterium]